MIIILIEEDKKDTSVNGICAIERFECSLENEDLCENTISEYDFSIKESGMFAIMELADKRIGFRCLNRNIKNYSIVLNNVEEALFLYNNLIREIRLPSKIFITVDTIRKTSDKKLESLLKNINDNKIKIIQTSNDIKKYLKKK